MLLEYSVSNFRSFKEETVLSMVASKDSDKVSENVFVSGYRNLKALNCAVVYGPNGSGKSNLFQSFAFFRNFVLNSLRNLDKENQDIKPIPFLLDTVTRNHPSSFQVIFETNGTKYRYGLEMDQEKIHHEWLYASYTARESELFFRKEQTIKVGPKFKEGKGLDKKTRADVPFLSVVASLNGDTSLHIIKWLVHFQILSSRTRSLRTFKILNSPNEESREATMIKNLLYEADFGVIDVQVSEEQIPLDDFKKTHKNAIFPINPSNQPSVISVITEKTGHQVFNSEQKKDSIYYFKLEEESEGIKKAYALAGPIIEALSSGWPLFIDEMDCSLHPLLMDELIKLFQSETTNPKHSQLIFTTHNTTYLKQKAFRRDQIWMLSKDQYGCSELYSLYDFDKHIRKDASWEKEYLLGFYGATPNILNLAEKIAPDYE